MRLLTAAFALCLAACDHVASDGSGIDLAVTVPADVEVRELTYQLLGNGIKPLVSTWGTEEPQHQFQKLIPQVPPGTSYHLTVTAKSVDQRSTCLRETIVDVQPDAITHVHAALSCNGGEGSIVISVGVACTKVQLATFMVSPLSAHLGETISLSAMPLTDAGVLTYQWTAPSGTFDNAQGSQTAYRCDKAGHIVLNLLVVARDICQENHSIEIDCLGG